MSYATLQDLKEAIKDAEVGLKMAGIGLDEIPVLMTEDDEVNGIHTSWNQSGLINKDFIESIRSTGGGVSIPPKAEKAPYFFLIE